MDPIPEVEVVLVSDTPRTPYSGMLPGRLAGWYSDEEMHFHLARICASSGIVYLNDRALRVNDSDGRVYLESHPPLEFGIASLNVGITPRLPEGATAHAHVIAVKPISRLLAKWEALLQRAGDQPARWLVVGGGPSGFELAVILAMRSLQQKWNLQVSLLEEGMDILPSQSFRVRSRARAILAHHGIHVHTGWRVQRVDGMSLVATTGSRLEFDEALFTTGACAPEWFKTCGFELSREGFAVVDEFLRVHGTSRIFASGDCAHFAPQPLAKSGVFAVRQGPTLIRNIRSHIQGKNDRQPYRPQRRALALLTSGPRRALLAYGSLALEGSWIWRWKSWIDRRFMRRFSPPSEA